MSTLRVLCCDHPQRTIALTTNEYALIFRNTPTPAESQGSTAHQSIDTPRCIVEFSSLSSVDLGDYRHLADGHGTLGLITLNNDVFLCVVTASSRAATVRPGETVLRIDNVEFFCINRSDYENGLDYELGSRFAAEEPNYSSGYEGRDVVTDHPFLALKKLLNDGSFYYSLDFNLTDRLQDRSDESAAFDIESLDEDMLWNSYMISPLLLFRSRLADHEKESLDSSRILTSVIRGFAGTLTIPASVPLLPQVRSNLPATLTVISRQSSRRAGTRFNSRGIDDDGNVANFVETETVLWCPPGISFSYVQVRGSVPIFWEQTPGLLPGQQKIEITRSFEATQHAFDKHFEYLELEYGAVHVVNLLSEEKSGEAQLSAKFREHIARSSLRRKAELGASSEHNLLRATEFDFHAETRGPIGYEGSSQIRHKIEHSLDGFAYFLSEDVFGAADSLSNERDDSKSSTVILQQEGVFRTNCLDCLDRTNLVQTIISLMALESFLGQQGGAVVPEFQMRHSSLWADNGDALSKIYAGTGALKSSFTRHGKMSLAGAFADARKSATRLYVNNFADKARQNTIDLLLGNLTNQVSVHLYDPINEMVTAELSRRVAEYSSTKTIRIWAGTFNLNGRSEGATADLSPWLFPPLEESLEDPTIVAVGFQEIVELSPQQIMSTDPRTRRVWEEAVKDCLNRHSEQRGTGKYVLLRSGQLVGAAILIYVKADVLGDIKNVEGSVKKTGLSGIGGNKGGCAIRFEYSSTRICFVTAHLAAGFANYDERNRDYETISNGLRFQRNRSIEDHDTVIWLGDFNYRIGLSDQRVRELVRQRKYDKLYENDQLNLQMVAGRTFQFYSEAPINFPPTYKYNIGTDEYDNSEKARIPAWCDRVLWKGANLRQEHYNTADLRFSDHRPVWATFECTISIVDEKLKDQLSRFLYDKRKHDIGDLTTLIGFEDTEDGELTGYGSIAPGLPPASSDHHKWWLDLGAPVRSTVRPPADGLIPNPHRKSNPFAFTSSEEPDWVYAPGSADGRKGSGFDPKSTFSKGIAPPKPPAPRRHGKSNMLLDQSDTVTEPKEVPFGETSTSTPASGKTLGEPKAPPPVPKKPALLSSSHNPNIDASSSSSRSSTTSSRHVHGLKDGSEWRPPLPGRRIESTDESLLQRNETRSTPLWSTGSAPTAVRTREINRAHPPSRESTDNVNKGAANDLLDNDTDEALKNWKPLLPQR